MTKYRYAKWEGGQDYSEPDADSLMHELERDLMSNGDLDEALRRLQAYSPPEIQASGIQQENQQTTYQDPSPYDILDAPVICRVVGEATDGEAAQSRSVTHILEDAGYIRLNDGKYELTPRGMGKIGQKALADIFFKLRRDRIHSHTFNRIHVGGERIEETKKFEFGDDFDIHLQKTMMNAIHRGGEKPRMKLRVDDFEVYREEAGTSSSTVLMIDLSLSMPKRGNFEAAKRVAVALDNLIRNQYPQDSLHVVGFSSYARLIERDELTYYVWQEDEHGSYTNIQHGLSLARKILSRQRSTTKQIIMISDGEPTAHYEAGELFTEYPPVPRTFQVTLKEVEKCTKDGITINTFMLENDPARCTFVARMARKNSGKVFFTSAENLGQYLLVDYMSK